MRQKISKKQFVNGTIWKIIETLMSFGVTFIVSLILARLLSPNDFGVIALTGVFINFSEIILQSAFSAPLIQKEKVDNADYTSVLIFSLMIAGLLYCIVFVTAPLFSSVYQQDILKPVLRVIAVIFAFQALGSVRIAIISRQMKFKTLSLCTVAAAISSGVFGVLLAVLGFGVWALVAQKILYQAVLNIVLFAVIKWKPSLEGISFARVKELLSFGSRVLASSIVSYVSDSSVSLITGKVYSVSALGYSSKGMQYPCDLSISTFQAVSTALFPTLASYQTSREMQKQIMRKVIGVVAFLLFPMMAGLFVVAKPFILFLLTEKWIESVPFMQAACVYYCATPLMLINVQLYHSVGNGSVRVRLEMIKLICTAGTLLIGAVLLGISLESVFIIRACIEVIIAALSVIGLKKTIDYSYGEYIQDLKMPAILTVCMSIIVGLIGMLLNMPNNTELAIQVTAGIFVYTILSMIFKPNGYSDLLIILREKTKHA